MNPATVKINNPNEEGYIVINKEDFEEGNHTLFVETPAEGSSKPPSKTEGSSKPPSKQESK